jgi:hypothetical protein
MGTIEERARAFALYRRDETPWAGMPCRFDQLPVILQDRYLSLAKGKK